MKNYRVKRMTGISILAAVTIVLALISNNVTIATVNINLALIPIVVGACIYGPTAAPMALSAGLTTEQDMPQNAEFFSYN